MIHLQGAPGPPGGIGGMGAVGEKVRTKNLKDADAYLSASVVDYSKIILLPPMYFAQK